MAKVNIKIEGIPFDIYYYIINNNYYLYQIKHDA